MNKLVYEFGEDGYKVMGFADKYIVLDVGDNCEKLVMQYKCMLAHNYDLMRAEAYLQQMFFREGTSLIDGALINSAVQLVVRCDASGSDKGRPKLDYKKEFRTFAKAKGEEDLEAVYLRYDNLRNQVITHDQGKYQENYIGLTIEKETGLAVDVTRVMKHTHFVFEQNKDELLRLIRISIMFVTEQLDKISLKLLEWYNDNKNSVELHLFELPQGIKYNHW